MNRIRLSASICLSLSLVLAACSSNAETVVTGESTSTTKAMAGTTLAADITGPTPVIVDYSPTVSDVGGLLYLLSNPEVEVIAVSLPVTGEAGCELGLEVTLGILAMFDQGHVPVACDPDVAAGARAWPAAFLEGQENLSFGLPEFDGTEADLTAPDLIAEAAADAGRPVVIWAVAPLTNVARALDRHPDLVGDLERIVIMGGAIDVPGNVEGTDAEWNLWVDVSAAADVLESGVPITLVPLDATDQVPVPAWYRRAIEEAEQSEAIAYLSSLVRIFPSVSSGFYYFWDELAATIVADAGLVITEEMNVVVAEGAADDGRTVRAGDGNPVDVAVGVPDPNAFYAEFLGRLAGSPVTVGATATPEEEAYFTALEVAFVGVDETLELIFNSPEFSADEYDGVFVVEGFALLFDAFAVADGMVVALEPPESMAAIHADYVGAVQRFGEAREDALAAIAGAGSWDDLDGVFASFDFGFQQACLALVSEAGLRGVELEIPC